MQPPYRQFPTLQAHKRRGLRTPIAALGAIACVVVAMTAFFGLSLTPRSNGALQSSGPGPLSMPPDSATPQSAVPDPSAGSTTAALPTETPGGSGTGSPPATTPRPSPRPTAARSQPAGSATAPTSSRPASPSAPPITAPPTDRPRPTPTKAPAAEAYGPGLGADGLANTVVGGPDGLATSFRFKATVTGPLTAVRIYIVTGTPGYSGGTGGRLEVSVQTDANGEPTGDVLASTTVVPGNTDPSAIGNLPLIRFASPPTLVAGQMFDLVFRDVDDSPADNFISVNSLFLDERDPTASEPRAEASALTQLLFDGSGWTTRPGFTPIVEFDYDGAHVQGVGYIEVWVDAPKPVSGDAAVREVLTPTAAVAVRSVTVRVLRVTGDSPLVARLESSSGAVLGTAAVAAANVPIGDPSSDRGSGWVTLRFDRRVTLAAGKSYHLVLSTAPDTVYSAFVIRKGSDYGFRSSTFFADGFGQYTDGTRWTGFDQPGGMVDSSQGDLQLYFQ